MSDEIKERAKALTDQAKGKVQRTWGEMTGDEEAKTEGAINETKGKARQAKEDIKDTVKDAIRPAGDHARR